MIEYIHVEGSTKMDRKLKVVNLVLLPWMYYKDQHNWICGHPCIQAHGTLDQTSEYAHLTETFLERNKLLMKLQFSILPTKPQLHFSSHCLLGEEPEDLCAQHLPSGPVKCKHYLKASQEK